MTTAVRRRARRRLGVAIVGAFVAGTVLVAGGPAGAVHDENLFELGPTPTPPTNIVGDGVADNGPDWADIFNADGTVNQAALGQFRWRGGVVRSRRALGKEAPRTRRRSAVLGGRTRTMTRSSPADCVAQGLPREL